MPGTRLPAVRIPAVVSGPGESQETAEDAILVELPPSNKFSISWADEASAAIPLPLASERPITLSSSEGESTDISEDEHRKGIPAARPAHTDQPDDTDFVTPTSHLELDRNPLDQAEQVPSIPRLSRAFSMPLPSQLGSLQNPRRASTSSDSPPVAESALEIGNFHELSLELADSVQMVIQTLLQLSPPQVLDPAKEQFSACSLSIPTPSISAMFTSMKNLNYMSANMSAFSTDSDTYENSVPHNDFDVGEMLQSVGDALSGVAAQAGVDLVLFHGDVGMKHVAVRGDESGLSYTLSHIIRQFISTCRRGDTVELGLFIHNSVDSTDSDTTRGSPSPDPSSSFRCVFHIAHRYGQTSLDDSADAGEERLPPHLNSLILRRLLRHINASLDVDVPPKIPIVGRACELVIVLEPGESSVVNSTGVLTPEEAAVVGNPEFQIAQEPSLKQLNQFVETLRGKKVTLHASSRGSFAHHLSSYLTTWGMDVSHVSTEPGAEGSHPERVDAAAEPVMNHGSEAALRSPSIPEASSSTMPSTNIRVTDSDALSFILIDDDVDVLRARLQKLKAERVYPLHLQSRKRPSLASNHRPRSSPQVARVMGQNYHSVAPLSQTVIVHFTSLANFKLVKDAIQSFFTLPNSASPRIPEVIVIPKPAGPRRFLTALHTAVTKPVVDPFFMPIATSPISPGLHGLSPFFNSANAPRSPSGRSTGSTRALGSDRSARSPKDFGDGQHHGPSSPHGVTDGMEYFSDAAVKLGTSPSTGLVIQSPDGQPAGIFFHPKPRASSTALPSPPPMERDRPDPNRPRGNSFRVSSNEYVTPRPGPRPSASSTPNSGSASSTTFRGIPQQQPSTLASDKVPSTGSEQSVPSPSEQQPSTSEPAGPRVSRRTSHVSPPMSPQGRSPGTPGGLSRRPTRRSHADNRGSESASQSKKAKMPGEPNIVPPISVLIVDDNPINQTILSTFMKKKKIKYDVAKNGEEAVQKWKSGIFHLILMDIQMPVMDGIEATKEIRRIEKMNGAVGFPSTPQSEGQQTPSEASTTDSRATSTPYRSSVIIVALTASSLQADRVAALAAGCNDFLTKPVSLQWLNSKIIEWGSIKALQMWADIRPEVVKSISTGQAAQAQQVARRLHVPEGRSTPTGSRSRSSSMSKRTPGTIFDPSKIVREPASIEKVATPDTPLSDNSLGVSSGDCTVVPPRERPASLESTAVTKPDSPATTGDKQDDVPPPSKAIIESATEEASKAEAAKADAKEPAERPPDGTTMPGETPSTPPEPQ